MKKLLLILALVLGIGVNAQNNNGVDFSLGANQEGFWLFGADFFVGEDIYGYTLGQGNNSSRYSRNVGYYRESTTILAVDYGRKLLPNFYIKGALGGLIGNRTIDGHFANYHGGNLLSVTTGGEGVYYAGGFKYVFPNKITAEANYGSMGVGLKIGYKF